MCFIRRIHTLLHLSLYHFPIMMNIMKEKPERWCNNIEIWVEKTWTLVLTHLSWTSQNGVCSICIWPTSFWFALGCERIIWKKQVEELWNYDWMAPPADQHQYEKKKSIWQRSVFTKWWGKKRRGIWVEGKKMFLFSDPPTGWFAWGHFRVSQMET